MSKSGRGWAIAGASLAALTAVYLAWSNRRLFTVNDITTGESTAYPEIRSRVHYAEVPHVLTAAEQALRRLPGWKLLVLDSENDAIEAEARVAGLFASDVTVYVVSLGHGQTRVTIRSRSRLGGGDWGRNAAHIRLLQRAMDDRLNTEAAF